MLDRERACKKVGPSVAILDPVHDAKGADSQVRTVASCVHHRYSRQGCGRRRHQRGITRERNSRKSNLLKFRAGR